MATVTQTRLGFADLAEPRIQILVDAQTCIVHPLTTVGEHACPLCAIDAAVRRAARAHPSAKQAAMA